MERITFVDPRQWLAAIIYFAALYLALKTPWYLAAGLAAAVIICWAFSFGRNWIMNAAVLLMLFAFAVVAGWIPQDWPVTVGPLSH